MSLLLYLRSAIERGDPYGREVINHAIIKHNSVFDCFHFWIQISLQLAVFNLKFFNPATEFMVKVCQRNKALRRTTLIESSNIIHRHVTNQQNLPLSQRTFKFFQLSFPFLQFLLQANFFFFHSLGCLKENGRAIIQWGRKQTKQQLRVRIWLLHSYNLTEVTQPDCITIADRTIAHPPSAVKIMKTRWPRAASINFTQKNNRGRLSFRDKTWVLNAGGGDKMIKLCTLFLFR